MRVACSRSRPVLRSALAGPQSPVSRLMRKSSALYTRATLVMAAKLVMSDKLVMSAKLVMPVSAAVMMMFVSPAFADQTDPTLDALFEELRTGGAINAQANTDRILEIWADSQSDTVDLLYARALEKYHEGDLNTASKMLIHIRGLSPNYMQAYALSGFLNLRRDNQATALQNFSKALDLEPRHFEVRKAVAQLLLASGQKRDAYEMLQTGLEWNPFDEEMLAMARKLRVEFEGQEI